nr:MAG TPA: hypothetical protein [Caudoviricetes sp.]
MQLRPYHDLLRYLSNVVRPLPFPSHLTGILSTGWSLNVLLFKRSFAADCLSLI